MQNKKDEKIKFEEDIVQEVKADFLARQQARKNIERQWQLNMNYVMGNQYLAIDLNECIVRFLFFCKVRLL